MSDPRLRSVDQRLLDQLAEPLRAIDSDLIRNEIHSIGPEGVLITRSFKKAAEPQRAGGTTYLSGLADTVPFYLTSEFDLSGETEFDARVTMDMTHPVSLSYTWNYKITPSSVVQVPPPPSPPSNFNLDYWCIIRCGGKGIIKCLVSCLPTLIADPTGAAYAICVLGCAGGSWTTVVECVIDNCI
jgi:hypothetical protein